MSTYWVRGKKLGCEVAQQELVKIANNPLIPALTFEQKEFWKGIVDGYHECMEAKRKHDK